MNEIKPPAPLSPDELRGVFETALDRVAPRASSPREATIATAPAKPDHIDLNAFSALSDREFIEQAYARILKRRADMPGIRHYVESLAAGTSRILVLGELRYSAEGRTAGSVVPGLRMRFALHRLYRVKLLGRLLRTLTGIVALPGLLRDTSRFGIELRDYRNQTDQVVRALEREMRSRSDQFERGLERLEYSASQQSVLLDRQGKQIADQQEQEPWAPPILSLDDRLETTSQQLDLLAATLATMAPQIQAAAQLETEIAALRQEFAVPAADLGPAPEHGAQLAQRLDASLNEQRNLAARALTLADSNRARLLDQERRLLLMLGDLRRWMADGQIPRARLDHHETHLLDELYVAFEDRFRGSRADIKQRQSVYLDTLRDTGAGSPARPIVDVGSGRGELLELLGEAGLAARGVDLNESMVALCKTAGLDCTFGDAVGYLSALDEGSLGAVTGFHIIEHLPFAAMVALLDSSLRALARGGVVIFETPNPANVLVSSRWFHLDPTHRNPIPAEMVTMIAEARGFIQVEIRELHPMQRRFEAKDELLASQLDALFYGPQDYALIARKP